MAYCHIVCSLQFYTHTIRLVSQILKRYLNAKMEVEETSICCGEDSADNAGILVGLSLGTEVRQPPLSVGNLLPGGYSNSDWLAVSQSGFCNSDWLVVSQSE